ncbi:RES family NAD+ phosphorylase [Modestobacter sp. SSW1-42]|uniref:RES family NAD+ phosphorylase n=1 Tax=Modestobacter sp. SSW1-42 TaxID=596372 RepID=UPI003985F140
MTAPLDEAVVQQVNDLGTTTWSGTVHRYTNAVYDPLSGEGAYRFGGRWNPRRVFPTIYLADPLRACVLEFERAARAAAIDPAAMMRRGYVLHAITVTDLPLLDLRSPEALESVGLSLEDITGEDWSACQAVGHAAWFLEFGGVFAPSATGEGFVLAAFEGRLQAGHLSVGTSRRLDEDTYRTAIG